MNVYKLIGHDLSKISPLEAYNSVYKHENINLYESVYIFKAVFDSSEQEEDKNIQLGGYNLLKVNHPSSSKKGVYKQTLGVCIAKLLNFILSNNALFVNSL